MTNHKELSERLNKFNEEYFIKVREYFGKKKNKDLTFGGLFDRMSTNSRYQIIENYLDK